MIRRRTWTAGEKGKIREKENSSWADKKNSSSFNNTRKDVLATEERNIFKYFEKETKYFPR